MDDNHLIRLFDDSIIRLFLMGAVMAAGLTVGAAESGYSWRGYMLDVSRHFFTVDEVKKTLDAMAVVELNVFHWHLTDDTGWRIQIDAYPELTKAGATTTVSKKRTSTMGAYETEGAYGPYFYTKDEIRDVVAYGAKRGITVVPEIDIPGHSGGAIRAYPALACGRGRSPSGPSGGSELCIGKDETLRMYERILDEVLELFPSKAIHLGGDECNHKRWQQCPDCQRRIRENGLRGEKGLQGWFMAHFAKYLEGKGRRMVAWDDVVECGDLPKSTIAMLYRRKKNFGPTAAARGYDVVMTSGYYWDYVQGLAEDPYEYQPFGYNCTWQRVMRRDPAADFPPAIRRHLIGVQGCMWTELVCDIAGVEWRTWPRMAALADVMLNGPATDEAAFAKRLEETNGKLKAMGVNVAPLGPLFAEKPALEDGVRLLWQREDFAKMLPNPIDASVMCFDWKDRRNAFSKIYARLDPRYPSGAYLMDMDWLEIEVTASDETGFENARRQLRKLARMKKDGIMEFPSCRLACGDVPPDPVVVERDLAKKTFVSKSGAKLDYRWREPRHMQLGGNYPLHLLFGGTDAEVAAFLADIDSRFEEMFVCVLPYHADRALVDELVAELGWSIRCMNGKAVRRRDLTDTDPTADVSNP